MLTFFSTKEDIACCGTRCRRFWNAMMEEITEVLPLSQIPFISESGQDRNKDPVARNRSITSLVETATASNGNDVIDKASIIENKERTKIYWEQMMMAAAKENASGTHRRCNKNYKHLCKNANGYDDEKMMVSYAAEWDAEAELVKSRNEKNGNVSVKDDPADAVPLSMEGKIALELQEMKRREEELREWRNKVASENCKDMTLPKDTLIANGTEELSSLHTTDDSNYSEYGSEEKEHSLDDNGSRVNTPYSEVYMHARTQSLDSVSSGHSSGSGSTLNDRDRESLRRKVIVRPYEDPEEEEYPCYVWDGKETPIEREIRLAREREEELRREKGTAAVIENCRELGRRMKEKPLNKSSPVENDPRGIQHRLATSRIQQEIEEANERERELRTEGKIISTSEDTLDSKVTRLSQLVENSITETMLREQKTKKSSTNAKFFDKQNGENQERSFEKTPSPRFRGTFTKKGVMEQFFSMKGKPFVAGLNVQPQYSDEELQPVRPASKQSFSSASGVVHTRKGYTPVSEKIQEELKDNQKREEELRLQRAQTLARSQPDLLAVIENEEDRQSSWTGREEHFVPRLTHSLSNPNLLDDGIDKMNKRPSNKKFSLLEEWEKRIRENIQKD